MQQSGKNKNAAIWVSWSQSFLCSATGCTQSIYPCTHVSHTEINSMLLGSCLEVPGTVCWVFARSTLLVTELTDPPTSFLTMQVASPCHAHISLCPWGPLAACGPGLPRQWSDMRPPTACGIIQVCLSWNHSLDIQALHSKINLCRIPASQ